MMPFADAKDIAIAFLSNYTDDGGQAPARPTNRAFDWPALTDLPAYELADREPEFSLFQALVSGQPTPRIPLLYGPSDRGKSVLLAQFSRSLSDWMGYRSPIVGSRPRCRSTPCWGRCGAT